jgi:hypothetical protein
MVWVAIQEIPYDDHMIDTQAGCMCGMYLHNVIKCHFKGLE